MAREVVAFSNEDIPLHGVLYRPEGDGPFPAVLYNHGSAPGMLNEQAFEQLGPLFAGNGWMFFAPYRRGQGPSEAAGPYIGDEIAAARSEQAWKGASLAIPTVGLLLFVVSRRSRARRWVPFGLVLCAAAVLAVSLSSTRAAADTMVRLLETDHLSDQAAGFRWLSEQPDVQPHRIATAGNSYGGVQAVLGAERLDYCAAVDGAGGAESWARAPRLRARLTEAVRNAKAPIFFFQAENDYDVAPTRTLSAEMERAHEPVEWKLYPPFGASAADGHRFAWAGSAIWAADVLRFLDTHCP